MGLFKKKKESNVTIIKIKGYDSDKEAPSLEKLKERSNELYNLIMNGHRDEVNEVESRFLVYGVDCIDWINETFNLKIDLKEDNIRYLDKYLAIIKEGYDKKQIDDKMTYGYLSGIVGIFGIIASHYKNASWINEKRDDMGYKMKINDTIYLVENMAMKVFNGEEESSLEAIYFSMPY